MPRTRSDFWAASRRSRHSKSGCSSSALGWWQSPAQKTAVMAATQRPASLVALGEPSAAAAWKTIPAWALVATQDNAIGTANVRAMAKHAGAQIVEVDASHAVLVSQPDAVVRLIRTAAHSSD